MRNNLYSAEPQILDDSDEDFDPKTEDIHQKTFISIVK